MSITNWMQSAVPSSHKGRFTAWAKANGFSSVSAAASHVLANKSNYSTHVVKMAQLAHTFEQEAK